MTSEAQVKCKATVTQSAFDTEQKPSKYIGVESPPTDPNEVARDVFNLCPSPDPSAQFYSPMNYSGAFFPFYTPPNQFGIPYENFETVMAGSSSNSSTASPNANGTVTATMLPPYPQYAMPFPFPYFLGGQYPMYSPGGVTGGQHQNSDDPPPKLVTARHPVSVKVLSSSDQVKEASASNTHLPQKGIGGGSGGAKKGRHQSNSDYSSYGYNNVASLSSPLKKMKVLNGQAATEKRGAVDESISSYFADVSANGICSDEDDAEENAEVSNIMSLLSQQHSAATPALADLGQITTKEKEDLEQITGTSDLSTLLSSGLESMKARGTLRNSFTSQSPPPDFIPEPQQEKFLFSDDCTGITSMDVNDIDTKVATAQEDNYYLPSIDSLLNIGDGTIVTMKAAMNLDIQGVVEVVTVDDSSKEDKGAGDAVPTSANADTSTDEIQID